MKKGNILFVRTDYPVDGTYVTDKDFAEHLKHLEKIAEKRFFMGGGFIKKPGGMIVFEAENKAEAVQISDGDPLISRGLYKYELTEWEMLILSKNL